MVLHPVPTPARLICRWAKDTGHLEITGGTGRSDFASSLTPAQRAGPCIARRNGCHRLDRENRGACGRFARSRGARSVSWPRRSRLGTFQLVGTFQLLGHSNRIAQVWRRVVQSIDAALVLCVGLTRFGRHGHAGWCGQEGTGGTRAAFRAGGRQVAFRHRPHLCERPAFLAHIFVCRHRPPASGLNASCGGPVRRGCGKLYQLTAGL